MKLTPARWWTAAICTVVINVGSTLMPNLTGKTTLTKLQIAVITISCAMVVAGTVKALALDPTAIDSGDKKDTNG